MRPAGIKEGRVVAETVATFAATLEAEGLAAGRGDLELFSGVSFRLKPGGGLTLTGPNGSGKTTLLRILAGLVRPLAGRVALQGASGDGADSPGFHYFGHANAMKPQLSVGDNLAFWAAYQNGAAAKGAELQASIRGALSAVGLARVVALPFNVLSSGQKRRAAFARLLITPAPVWLLDEPNAGLDAAATATLDAMMARHRAHGGIVIVATHLALGGEWQSLDLSTAALASGGAS
jgi:heme exporter protein A